jgi:hypothetical protein
MSKKNARVTRAPATPPSSGALTVDERDAIDTAEGRAKGMLTLVMATLNEDDVIVTDRFGEDRTDALLTACDVIREAFIAIDEILHQADERRDAATAAAGGAN